MNRPSKDITWLRICLDLAEQSTCLRRQVGCVILNTRGHVSSTGWNGVATGKPHCNQFVERDDNEAGYDVVHGAYNHQYPNACLGAWLKSGTGIDNCGAIHAEQNALMQCKDVWDIHTLYCTTEPCVPCTKLLLATSCRRVVYLEPYAGAGDVAGELFTNRKAGSWLWEQHPSVR